MRNHLRALCTLSVFVFLCPALSSGSGYKVLKVINGNTVFINYDGRPVKLRLLCIKTPASNRSENRRDSAMEACVKYMEKRLAGRDVEIEFEGSEWGKYKHLLAYVFIDGKNFNLEMVRKGFSPYYTKSGASKKYDKEFREAETHAKKFKLNIWSDSDLTLKEYIRSKWGKGKP